MRTGFGVRERRRRYVGHGTEGLAG
jgi:hypothetical protein